jgi:methylthioribulose-1-phosphate dehydratase
VIHATPTNPHDAERLHHLARELVQAGAFLYGKGWVPATSGNFSARLSDDRVAITESGHHKGALSVDHIMVVDLDGRPLEPARRPSAETLLHTTLYRRWPGLGAVLHTHSMNATLLSRQAGGPLTLEGYELLKAFPGVVTHETTVTVPVFPNDQDIPRLGAKVEQWLDEQPDTHGYLIAGHGLYTWGASVSDALRHVEAFEFLFQCELHLLRS